ncbi:hypothetical protein [Mycobacterium sp. ZZG]
MATDPVLKQLVADTNAAEESVPLDLYLPSGKLFGWTTSVYDFGRRITHELETETGYTGVVEPEDDPEYVHLIVRPLTMPGEQETTEVVRVRLADVVAWTVG